MDVKTNVVIVLDKKNLDIKDDNYFLKPYNSERYPYEHKIESLIKKANDANSNNSDKFENIKEKAFLNKIKL